MSFALRFFTISGFAYAMIYLVERLLELSLLKPKSISSKINFSFLKFKSNSLFFLLFEFLVEYGVASILVELGSFVLLQ